MNSQQNLKSNVVRLGTCSRCNKSFLSGYLEDSRTILETIRDFWKPNLCDACRKLNEAKQIPTNTAKTSG